MRLSNSFTKTIREVPADEEAANAQLLIRAGFISKVMAGVYNYMPLGYRVLDKVNKIIREEMDSTGASELHMSVLQNKNIWDATGRWDSAKEVMYQFKDDSGKDMGLGWTHEEPLTEAAKRYISSYKDLPKAVYQIQNKFRNEARPKSGLLRGREFLMKDLYSFHTTEESLNEYYEKVAQAYLNVFERSGIPSKRTLASGGLFSDFSDEFQVPSDVGEDTIYYCDQCDYTVNDEVAEKINLAENCEKCTGKMIKGKGIEVGNIFKLGTKFSEALGLMFTDEKGEKKPVIMASYGIGPGRLIGTVVETHNDERGMIWPESIAPYKFHLVKLDDREEADEVYDALVNAGVEVLYDDRKDNSAGEKFADADLIGCPYRLVVSNKTMENNQIEVKKRTEKEIKMIEFDKVLDLVK